MTDTATPQTEISDSELQDTIERTADTLKSSLTGPFPGLLADLEEVFASLAASRAREAALREELKQRLESLIAHHTTALDGDDPKGACAAHHRGAILALKLVLDEFAG